MMQRVLVALDGSDHARRALELACEVAEKFDAELLAVHVVSRKPLSDDERRMAAVEFHAEITRGFDPTVLIDARSDSRLLGQRLAEQAAETGRRFRWAMGERMLADAGAIAREVGVGTVRPHLAEGDPADVILHLVGSECVDLVVMGRRGLGDLTGLLLGSVSHKVTHLADCACLTVK
jgi:nucleotide-binding universal stress UspA family protein